MHDKDSELIGKKIRIKEGLTPELSGQRIVIVNWVDRMPGNKSWMDYGPENMATWHYAMRKGTDFDENDPQVDEVLYGKIGSLGFCVHINELLFDV